jgi:hypothetical protein
MKHLIHWPLCSLLVAGCALPSAKPAHIPSEGKPPPSTHEVVGSLPFTLHDNRLLVDVFLNGQGPFVMVFDAGGVNTLTPEVQKVLDIRSQGLEYSMDEGERSIDAPSVHLKSVQAGDLKLSDQKFIVVNLTPIRRAFRFPHLDGVIGLEFLKLAKVRIDFDKQMIEMLSPEANQLPTAQSMNFELMNDRPIIEGKINGQPAKILLDTADRSNLTLFRRFAATTQLDELFSHRDPILTGMGVHGPIKGKLASVQAVDFGTDEVTDVLTRLPMTKRGYFFSNRISASAGIGILKNYNLEFDYKKQVVALQRRKDFKDPSTFVPLPSRER